MDGPPVPDQDAAPRAAKSRRFDAITRTADPESEDSGAPEAAGGVERGPYYEADPWRGYFWIAKTGADTTIEPSKSFDAETFNAQVCIKGSVAPSADSSGNAMLGINISQAMHSNAAPAAIAPSGAGVHVQLAAAVSAPLRIQIAATDGTTNPRARWCAAVSGRDSFVPWTAFNTACWDGSGEPYGQEPISVAMLLVPGNAQSAVDYDVCLRHIGPGQSH